MRWRRPFRRGKALVHVLAIESRSGPIGLFRQSFFFLFAGVAFLMFYRAAELCLDEAISAFLLLSLESQLTSMIWDLFYGQSIDGDFIS